jgi:hypothetical protein
MVFFFFFEKYIANVAHLAETRRSIGAVVEIKQLKDLSYAETKLLVPIPVESQIKPAEAQAQAQDAMDEDRSRTEKTTSKKRRFEAEKK